MKTNTKNILKRIIIAIVLTIIGILLFKYIPMLAWGENILFDASAHVAWTMIILYIIWFFIKQEWKTTYIIFACIVLLAVSVHRIINQAHNIMGLLIGFYIVVIAIAISQWSNIKAKW